MNKSHVQSKKRSTPENSNLLVDPHDLLSALRRQIEFYFSDSNLARDEFLSKLLGSSASGREVDVSVVLGFSRVKSLLQSILDVNEKVEVIGRALKDSELVQLSREASKLIRQRAFRRQDFNRAEADSRTVYVEILPDTVTHEILASVCAKYGTITHVSLPRHPDTRKPKGFAFIEYSSASEAANCIKEMNKKVVDELNVKEKSTPLRVMPMTEWLSYKAEFNKLLKDIDELNSKIRDKSKPIIEKKHDTYIIRLEDLPPHTTRQHVQIMVTQIERPERVYYTRGENFAYIHFASSKEAQSFLSRSPGKMNSVRAIELTEKEQEEYLKKAEEEKQDFKEYIESKHSSKN